ncbi:MAG: hypothetical protein MUE95_03010 [Cyclobacteriaceae bacterium]|jgi:hypothetical protein|nr:hypothetical protein [Cyclobacteriaceae bacterium]
MNTPNQPFDPQQSLTFITGMIRQAQGKMQKNSFYFLLWGWAIASAYLGMYVLMAFTDYQHPYVVWLIIIPAWIVTMIYGRKQDRQAQVFTHLDRINMWLWISFGLAVLPIAIFGSKLNFNISPVILCMTAIPTFLTGIMLRFKPLLYGGINFWLCSIIAFLVDYQTQYLVGGIAIVLGYLVPGYMLRSTIEK